MEANTKKSENDDESPLKFADIKFKVEPDIVGSASCRVCLEELINLRQPLTTLYHNGLSYEEIYRKCTGLNLHIDDPDYPMMICERCDEELLICYTFVKKCTDTEERLGVIFKPKSRIDFESMSQPKNEEVLVQNLDVVEESPVISQQRTTCQPKIKKVAEETCAITKELAEPKKVVKRMEMEIELLTEGDLDEQINKQLQQIPTSIGVDDPVMKSDKKIKVVCSICGKMVNKCSE
jgi:hypothetical protein